MNNTTTITIENLKCNGCVSTIKSALLKFNEVNNVKINLSTSSVEIHFTGDKDNAKRYRQVLAEMGYPEKGNNNSIYVVRSFVSCVRGRIKH